MSDTPSAENKPKKILIVDDEPIIVRVLESRLKTQGYEVVNAYDGQEGLNKVRLENPDLIILDIMLPKMDGYRVCRLLKLDDKYKHIPVLMLSARVQNEDKEKGMAAGADAYITKPFNPKELLDTIQALLQT
ncbi:MAG: response regulator [Candidatus Omnitrophica bacterium]|nr:response regulator [Candidatus Omnitrophota bacterium]